MNKLLNRVVVSSAASLNFHPTRAIRDLGRAWRNLMEQTTHALVHGPVGQVDGFLIGNLLPSPPSFRLSVVTCHVDDFWVAESRDWSSVGNALLQSARRVAKARDAAQVAVICGHLDQPKRTMLASAGLAISSEWWVKVFDTMVPVTSP